MGGMDALNQDLGTPSDVVEPLDDWLHVQPSMDEDRKGRIYLPASVEGSRLLRCVVLAAGETVTALHAGDLVLVLGAKTIELRDGTHLARREFAVARLR